MTCVSPVIDATLDLGSPPHQRVRPTMLVLRGGARNVGERRRMAEGLGPSTLQGPDDAGLLPAPNAMSIPSDRTTKLPSESRILGRVGSDISVLIDFHEETLMSSGDALRTPAIWTNPETCLLIPTPLPV